MGPKSPSGLARLGAPFSSRYYAQSLEYYGRRNMFYSSVVAAAFATVMLFVALKAGTQYFKERSLLHGAHAVGRILELTIAPQQDKSHRITYSTTVGYAFKTPGRDDVTGSAHRELNRRPVFVTGGAIDILYDENNPELNSINAGFGDDLNGKLFVASLALFLAMYFGLIASRYVQWGKAEASR